MSKYVIVYTKHHEVDKDKPVTEVCAVRRNSEEKSVLTNYLRQLAHHYVMRNDRRTRNPIGATYEWITGELDHKTRKTELVIKVYDPLSKDHLFMSMKICLVSDIPWASWM